ncbi:MAG: prepilin peptidase [Candidatus Marinimicrobia bacterium]|nr:prepilin peptidase [Candidatus Neomarinimicrobiota bacterium]MCF7904817.1 prepilin peptidase [Candidatus Neomarinimicrobiota bacterium]
MVEVLGIVIIASVFAILSNNTIDQTPLKRIFKAPTPYCPTCATKLSWKDMLPFISYIRTQGKCPYCSAGLPIRHILIDMLELAWVACYILKYGWTFEGSIALIYGMALIVILFLIKEKRELSDSSLIIMGMLAVINFLAYNPDRFPEAAISMILGAMALAIYNLTKMFITDDSNFELTELKLGALLGLFLGMALGLIALAFALVSGAIIGIINNKYFKKPKSASIPQFGQLLAAGGLFAILLGHDVLDIYSRFLT